MTKKKVIIIVSIVLGIAAIALAAYFIINAVMFRGPNIEYPYDGDGSEHTVTFEANGGTVTDSVTVRDGNPVRRPATPERDGYFLTGWYKDEGLGDEWDFDKDRVKSDLTLYAGWRENVNVQPTASLVYAKDGDSYTVTGAGEDTVIVIPSEHEGLPVTKIGESAFARKAVTRITIPDSIAEIEKNAFNNCSYLVSAEIGENSRLAVIGRNAFSGCGALENIFIPQDVTDIGDSAFNNCGKINFNVSARNSVYRSENGHLIERETDTLIRGGQSGIVPDGVKIIAQAAFRKSAAVPVLSIPQSVIEIGNYIISDSAVTSVSYAGSESGWNEISKGRMWDSGKRGVEIQFNGQP